MIESKIKRTNSIWVMIALGVSSILASLYSIWQGYGQFFKGTTADAFIAVLQIILFDGAVSVAIAYIWATVVHIIMTRTMYALVITRSDFVFFYMLFLTAARLVCAALNAFQFLNPALAVFTNYLTNMIFTLSAMAVYFFFILKKQYLKNGVTHRAFLGFAAPFLALHGLNFLLNSILYAGASYFEPMLKELGYTYVYDKNELWAIIAGALALVIFIALAVYAYYRLKKADKTVQPEVTDSGGERSQDRVFEEFDI